MVRLVRSAARGALRRGGGDMHVDGPAADNNWSSAGKWDGCGGAHPTPQAGDSLVFPAGTARADAA